MNLTLVAYYGEKPPELRDFIHETQAELSKLLGRAFLPYDLQQVHATIIGLEGARIPDSDRVINSNYLELRAQLRFVDLRKLTDLIQASELLPMTVRLGGYQDGGLYPFTSRGQHPYLRSFSVQGQTTVAMGWPVDGAKYPLSLDLLRRSVTEAGVLHKYHSSPSDIDNDFFFVLGHIEPASVTEQAVERAQLQMRQFLARQPPYDLDVSHDDLTLVAYKNPTLPPATSRSYALAEVQIHLAEILDRYQLAEG